MSTNCISALYINSKDVWHHLFVSSLLLIYKHAENSLKQPTRSQVSEWVSEWVGGGRVGGREGGRERVSEWFFKNIMVRTNYILTILMMFLCIRPTCWVICIVLVPCAWLDISLLFGILCRLQANQSLLLTP